MDFVIQFLNMSTPTGNKDFPTSTINISINSHGPDNSSSGYEISSEPLNVVVQAFIILFLIKIIHV
jgi:hypothetical protein